MRGAETVYLAYTKSTRPTGKNMAKTLGLTSFGIRPCPYGTDVLIRWGSRRAMPPCGVVLNDVSAIARASDKMVTMEYLAAAGLATPRVYKTLKEAWENEGRGHVIYGRSRTGFGGKDIELYTDHKEEARRQHDFYTAYVGSRREIRIHVVGEKVVRVQGKYLDFPEDDDGGYIRNYAHGYRFRTPRQELRPGRRTAAIKAVQALGLDFGAVDMLLTGENTGVILEVNTAPACSPLTARCYAGEIALLVDRRTKGAVKIAPELLEIEDEYYEEEE